jgi:3-hydroxyacyl-CoA dehydrogenase
MATTISPPGNATSAPIQLETRDGVAVVWVNNPPVNALSTAVRQGLADAFSTLADDTEIDGIVLAATGRTFMAGADIREFNAPPEPPLLPDLIAVIETSPHPTVAAIFGTALGGGFECALACRLRVMTKAARVGLPEVKLGIVPGAGGTQRVLRLAGFEATADLVTSGRMVGSRGALELGLVDHVTDSDPVDAAIAVLKDHVAAANLPESASRRSVSAPAQDLVARLKSETAAKSRGQIAPMRALDLLEETASLSFEEAVARDRDLFLELREGNQAKALRHLFLAERAAGRPDELAKVEPREIGRVGVVGGGLMGSGIGYAALLSGYEVVVAEQDASALVRTRERFDALFAGAIKRGRLNEGDKDRLMNRIALTNDMSDLAEADLVIEAAFEDMDVKRDIFQALDATLRPEAVLASNTSYLDIDTIAQAVRDPSRVLGLHFFSPAHVMRLMEVVRGADTAPDVLASGLAVARKLGKIPVITGVCDGFCGNRILKAYRTVAEFLVEDGAAPQDVDAAMTAFGFPMGPFAVQDMAGLEIAYANRKRQGDPADPAERRPHLLERLVESGRLGQKNQKGWYRYQEGARGGQSDPETDAIIQAAAAEKGITRTPFPAEEIERRLLAAMINEGARILQEGIVAHSSDVDLVMVHGYGFPRHRGGPMFLAEQNGFERVLEDVAALHRAYGEGWEPAGWLTDAAKNNA